MNQSRAGRRGFGLRCHYERLSRLRISASATKIMAEGPGPSGIGKPFTFQVNLNKPVIKPNYTIQVNVGPVIVNKPDIRRESEYADAVETLTRESTADSFQDASEMNDSIGELAITKSDEVVAVPRKTLIRTDRDSDRAKLYGKVYTDLPDLHSLPSPDSHSTGRSQRSNYIATNSG